MTGSAVASIPIVAVLRIAQGPPPVAVNLPATSQPGPE
jgi:hypothetical protein